MFWMIDKEETHGGSMVQVARAQALQVQQNNFESGGCQIATGRPNLVE